MYENQIKRHGKGRVNMHLTDRLGCSDPPGKDAVLWFLGFLNRYKFGIKSTLNSFTHTYLVGWNSCAMLGIYRE